MSNTALNTKELELLKELNLDPNSVDLKTQVQKKLLELKAAAKKNEDIRIVLKLPYKLAPYKLAILPLMKKDGLKEKAEEIYISLRKQGISTDYDDAGSIGKRYRRQDENGTPWCVCVDYQSLEDDTVTIRNRDTMEQSRVKIEELSGLNKELV